MFGQNAVASPRPLASGYTVNSIWFTIQGEGPWAGHSAIFVRFTGCNLKCYFCDTEFETGEQHSLEELVGLIVSYSQQHNCPRIVLTGGEPMLYDLFALVYELTQRAALVFQVETAGTVWPKNLESVLSAVLIVTSPKTPRVNAMIALHTHAWKYIIKAGEVSQEDGLPNRSTQVVGDKEVTIYRPLNKYAQIYVQPCDEGDDTKNKANIAETANSVLQHHYRLSIQLHKIVGVD